MYVITLISIILNTVFYSDCARILVINPTPSYSHQIVSRPIAHKLAQIGHDVVYATTISANSTRNLKIIDLSFSYKPFKDFISQPENSLLYIFDLLDYIIYIHDLQLQHPEMAELITDRNEKFDLIITEYFLPTMFAFKKLFNCPFIGVSSLDVIAEDHKVFGNAFDPILYPDSYLFHKKDGGFFGRLATFLMGCYSTWFRMYTVFPKSNAVVRKHFGPGFDVEAIADEVDMLFVLSNRVVNEIRPVTRSTVFIDGGIHLEENKELSKPLKEYMDKSKRGVIYVSFGSNVNTAQLPKPLQQMFFKAFADLQYDVLWKFEDENLPNKPDNVKLLKWVPQQDLLRHKNVKVFVTHAGLQSSEEGLLFKVPMLAIPFFADQPYNAYQIAKRGIGLKIDNLDNLSSEELTGLILELINNRTYADNLNILAAIAKDEPMTPLERAVWWTEYVLRHKGAKHLRGPVVPFYQHYLLDIFAFLLLILIIVVFVSYKIIKCLVVHIFNKFFKQELKLKQT